MKFVSILAAVAVLGMASYMMGDEPAKAPTTEPTTKPHNSTDFVMGKILKIDGTTLTIRVHHKDEAAKEVTVKTDGKTVVVIAQEEAKFADLKVDMHVRVTPKEGTATRIAAWERKSAETKPAAKGDK
jgi:hypothetical protein